MTITFYRDEFITEYDLGSLGLREVQIVFERPHPDEGIDILEVWLLNSLKDAGKHQSKLSDAGEHHLNIVDWLTSSDLDAMVDLAQDHEDGINNDYSPFTDDGDWAYDNWKDRQLEDRA